MYKNARAIDQLFHASCIIMGLFTTSLVADIVITEEARKDLAITIYKDFGVVRDTRTADLPKGINRIRFETVAAQLDPASAILDATRAEAKIDVWEQSYEFDLVSPEKLLEKFIGKQLQIIPSKTIWPDSGIQNAELISVHGREPVFRIGPNITSGQIGQILFPYMPDNLFTKPTLIWQISSPKKQRIDLGVTYVTNNIAWHSDYVLTLDKTGKSASLVGWLTIENNSGMDYDKANFICVAGDVNHGIMPRDQIQRPLMKSILSEDIAQGSNPEKAFEFYTFSVKSPVSVRNNQTKQVLWLPETKVATNPSYVVDFSSAPVFIRDGAPQIRQNASSVLTFGNTTAAGLGLSMPRGVVRVFARDATGYASFAGEQWLDDVAIDRTVTVAAANAFDIVAERKDLEVRRKQDGNFEVNRQITITNSKDKDVILKILENVGVGGKVVKSNFEAKKMSAAIVEWTVSVPAHGVYVLDALISSRD